MLVEACTNLANPIWTTVATNTLAMGVDPLTDGWTYFSDRGGVGVCLPGWDDDALLCRSADRDKGYPVDRGRIGYGFRVVLAAGQPGQ